MARVKESVTISAEITKSQKEILNELSESMDRSVSWVIRDAIENYKKLKSDVLSNGGK